MPLPYCLINSYTMERKGSKCVASVGSVDYRQITGTSCITLSGNFFTNLIDNLVECKTNRCHPDYNFPKEFDVTHSTNHWSNDEKLKELLLKIVIPYVKEKRRELGLRINKEWILITDIFRGPFVEENDIKMVPVPANMTHIFQLLNLLVTSSCKSSLQNESRQKVAGTKSHNIKVDVRTSGYKILSVPIPI